MMVFNQVILQKYKLLLMMTGMLFLFACTSPDEPPLRIGSNSWPGYLPIYLARDLGLHENSSIKLVELPSSTEVMRALRNHNLEGAALTLDEAFSLIQNDVDMRVILVIDVSDGGDVLISKPGIKELTDLKDKRVAVEYGAVGALLLDGALDAAGLNTNDIKIVPCTMDEHEDCFLSGKADAVVTFDPVKTRLLVQGANLLYDSSQMPGRIVDVLAVKKEVIETHPKSLQLLLSSYFNALDYFNENQQDAAIRMSAISKISPEELLTTYEGILLPSLAENKEMLTGESAPLIVIARDLSRLMFEKQLLEKEVSADFLINNKFLP